jgi:hypothetical protein
MGIEQTFSDLALLDVVAMLSSRDESGRLQITEGSTRGAFFFRKGKLVDARIGPFIGFQAVNLAVSIGRAASFSFDPSIEEPPASSFKVTERMLLRERFGIETAGPETARDRRIVTETAERALIPPQQAPLAEAAVPENASALPPKNEMEAINIDDDFTTPALSASVAIPLLAQPVASSETNPELSLNKLAFLLPSLRVLTTSLINSTRQKLAVRAALILLIVIPATIGVASYWSNGRAPAPLDVSPPQTSGALPAPVRVSPKDDEQTTRSKPTIEVMRRDAQPSTARTAAPLKVNGATIVSDAPSPDNTEAVSAVTAAGKAPEEELSLKPSSRAIAVVVQIEEGRVTEAYIRDHQAGLGDYEATALRLARQRRYPKDIKRKETVTLQVTVEP